MKLKSILAGALALAFVTAAQADVTIFVTGSSAFRAGTLDAIKTKFTTGASFKYAHDAAAGGVLGSTRSIFQGTFPGVTGVTTIACTFTGSVEGIRAVAAPGGANDATYLTTAALPAGSATASGLEGATTSSPVAAATATFGFSDVRRTSTPVTTVLNPADARVGVVVFTPIANNGAPAGLTNVTAQEFKALFSGGRLFLNRFTGNNADATKPVFAMGRNDGSGTRTTYMAESGLGITTLVQQYVVTASTSTAISAIQNVTAGGNTTPVNTANASTLWGQDVDGNGGYNSGSALRTDMTKTSTAVTVFDAGHNDIGSAPNIVLLSFLATPDANAARVLGAKILGWNGVTLDSLNTGTTLSATDKAKVTEGLYTAWGFEQMYFSGTLSTDQNTVYTAIKSGIPTRLVASGYLEGIPLTEMNVSRPDDGAPIP